MNALIWTLFTLLSHWRRRPLQLAGLILGLWLATALWSGVHHLNHQAKLSYDQAAQLFSQADTLSLVAPGNDLLEQQIWTDLRRQGWPLIPLLEGRLRLDSLDRRFQIIGIDPLSQQNLEGRLGQLTQTLSLNDFITSPGRTLVAASTLAEWDWQEGDRLLTESGQLLPPLVSREDLAANTLIMDLSWAQQALAAPNQLSRLLVPHDWLDPFADQRPQLPDHLHQQLRWQEVEEEADLARLTDSFHLNLTALGLLAFAVGLFIVHATLGLALEQRQGLFRTLRASGIPLQWLLVALVLELGLLGLGGGLAGLASGYWLAAALLPDFSASLQSLYGASIPGHLPFQPVTWVAGLGMSLLGMLLAGGSWLYKAKQLPLLSLARPQAWYQAESHRLRRQAILACAAALIALYAYWQGDSLLEGLLLLGGLLLAAALLLPLFLQAFLSAAGYLARHPLAQWFWADSRQQLPSLSLALMALLLAQAANIGVGTMTEGFRKTFTGWLDQRLAAEVYLRPESSEQAQEITAWLAEEARIDALLASYQAPSRIASWPIQVNSLADHATSRDYWPLLSQKADVWELFFGEQAWLISEQLANRQAIRLGDALTLTTPQGDQTGRVVGIYADYGNPHSQLLMSERAFQRFWPEIPATSYALRLAADQAEELVSELRQAFALDASRVIDQSSLKDWSTEVFDRTFTVTRALSQLTLGLAAVALFTSLLTLSQARLPQLAPLWAMGLSPSRLAAFNLLQLLLLALLTALFAMPLGLLLAWCLVSVVNVQAFGWQLPLHLFPNLLLMTLLGALLSALLAAIWPSWQLRQQGAGRLLKVFANAD